MTLTFKAKQSLQHIHEILIQLWLFRKAFKTNQKTPQMLCSLGTTHFNALKNKIKTERKYQLPSPTS